MNDKRAEIFFFARRAQKWDRSHYLENLSGFETNCAMVGTDEWPFSYTARIANMLRVRIVGQHGYARNLGSTPDALSNILSRFKNVRTPRPVLFSVREQMLLGTNVRRLQELISWRARCVGLTN